MKYFLVKLSDGSSISITEKEIETVVAGIINGSRAIIVSGGMFNAMHYVSIIDDKERMKEIKEAGKLGIKIPDESSEFAKLLSKKMPQLSPKSRTEAQLEASKEERKMKY